MSFLLCSDKSGKLEIVNELASKERIFYYQLALIWQAVLVPLLQSGKLHNYWRLICRLEKASSRKYKRISTLIMYLDPLQKRKLIRYLWWLSWDLNLDIQIESIEAIALVTGTSHLISALNDLLNQIQLLILQKYGLALACKRWVKFWHQSSRPFMTSWSVFPPIKQLSLSLCHQWLAFTSCSNCVGQMNFCKLLKGIRLCYTSYRYINFFVTLE